MKFLILLLGGVGLAFAQVPGFGGCPEFESQQDFDMRRYLGTWYETERYVNIFEAGTRCVKTNYTQAVDGRFLVANEIISRFTSVKRVLEGEIRFIVKGHESVMNVKYPNLPIPYETRYYVLETDYDSFSVIWSCSSLGIVNTQNAWILTRDKIAPGAVLQKAYGVLDKYKLNKNFFVKTDQKSCDLAERKPDKETSESLTSINDTLATTPTDGSGSKKPVKKGGQRKGTTTTGRDELLSSDVSVKEINSEVSAEQKLETVTI